MTIVVTPGYATIHAYRGGGPVLDITRFEGFDYAAATFTMEIRDYADDTVSARVSLSNAASNAQGVSCTTSTDDGVVTSEVLIRINETTIEGLPKSSPPGADKVFVYALDIAGGGHEKQRRLRGDFIVHPGENA